MEKKILLDLSHIPDLILKLNIRLYFFLCRVKWHPFKAIKTERTKNLNRILLKFVVILTLLKIIHKFYIANRKSCSNIKNFTDYGQIIYFCIIFIEKRIDLTALKGNNYKKKFKHIILESSWKWADVLHSHLYIPQIKRTIMIELLDTLLYPPQRSCRGVYWFHHVRPSVCRQILCRTIT